MNNLKRDFKLNKIHDSDSCVVVELDIDESASKRQRRILRDSSTTVAIKLISEERLNALAKIATEYQSNSKIEGHSSGRILSRIMKIITE